MAAMAQATYYRGHLRRGLELWSQVYSTAKDRGDELQEAWGLNGRAEGLLKLGGEGHLDDAISLLEKALERFAKNVDRVSQISTYGMLAMAHLRRDDASAARLAADEGMKIARQISSPTGYYSLGGYAGVARCFLDLWEASHDSGALARLAKQSSRLLNRYARTFQLGQTSA